MRSLICMLTFFTRIPIKSREPIQAEDFIHGIGWVPLIAMFIGLPMYLIGLLLPYVDLLVTALLGLLSYLYLSGGLHLDGMADTLDAFGSNRSRERMLEIMKDSRMGTFGVTAIVVYCLGFVFLFGAAPLYALLLFPLVGRSSALLGASLNQYAREEGMGKSFVDGARLWHFFLGSGLYALLAAVINAEGMHLMGYALRVLPFFLAACLTALLLRVMAKKLHGITGDMIGFSIELSQLIFLLLTYATVLIGGA